MSLSNPAFSRRVYAGANDLDFMPWNDICVKHETLERDNEGTGMR